MMKHREQTHVILHPEFLAEGWMREPSCAPFLPVDVESIGDSHSLVGCLEGEGTILPKACKLELLPQPLFLARCQSIKSRDWRFIPVPALYPHIKSGPGTADQCQNLSRSFKFLYLF